MKSLSFSALNRVLLLGLVAGIIFLYIYQIQFSFFPANSRRLLLPVLLVLSLFHYKKLIALFLKRKVLFFIV